MRKIYTFFILGVLLPLLAFSQNDNKHYLDSLFSKQIQKLSSSSNINDTPFDKVIPARANNQLQVFVYSYTQAVVQNFAPENEFLKGQIVGRLFGGNTTRTFEKQTANFYEQRFLPFFVYSPDIFDGKVTLRAAFKVDFTWGDSAYGVGAHTGGAISGSQVNLETQNVEIEYRPAPTWAVNVGLQRLYDTPHDPYRTTLDKMAVTGYKLNYWGTSGAGISVRKDADVYKLKGGYYKLYENQVEIVDDVSLYEFIGQTNVSKNWKIGASAYYLKDRSNGKGGVSILGQGPRSLLADYNGAYKFPLSPDPYKMDVYWLGAFFSRNEDMMNDRFFLSGYLNSNLGSIRQDNGAGYNKTVEIQGLAANLRAGYRYGQTTNDAVTADIIFSSPNKKGISDGKYTGVITGNTWGSPVGLMIGQGSYLIFPHANVVNRYVAAVSDLSNMGLGVTGGTINFGYDIIPNKFHSKVGTAFALSNQKPTGGDSFIGWEVNGKLAYDLGAFLTLEAHGAYMGLGDFYKSKEVNGNQEGKPADPWTTFVGLKWLIF